MIAQFIDGPLWTFSLGVFVVGVVWRIVTILMAGNRPDLATPRGSASAGAIRTVFSRSVYERSAATRGRLLMIAGYLFHLGLFALLLFAQGW